MLPTNITRRIADAYRLLGWGDEAEEQDLANQSMEAMTPVGSIDFESTVDGVKKSFRVVFREQVDGSLDTKISQLFPKQTPNRTDPTCLQENSIVHTGWFSEKKVSDMTNEEKKAFILKLNQMYVKSWTSGVLKLSENGLFFGRSPLAIAGEPFSLEFSDGNKQKMRASFQLSPTGSIEIRVSKIFTSSTSNTERPQTLDDDSIVHTGWLWSNKVSDMSQPDKDVFFERLRKMSVHSFDGKNLYVC